MLGVSKDSQLSSRIEKKSLLELKNQRVQ